MDICGFFRRVKAVAVFYHEQLFSSDSCALFLQDSSKFEEGLRNLGAGGEMADYDYLNHNLRFTYDL